MQIVMMFGIVVLLAIFFALLMIRDRENSAKFRQCERAIDQLLRENYALKKSLEALPSQDVDLSGLKMELENLIDERLRDKTLPMLATFKELKHRLSEQQDQQQSRISSLEERTRDISKVAPPTASSEAELILSQYRAGKSVEAIAKDLQVGMGHVEFALKMGGVSLN